MTKQDAAARFKLNTSATHLLHRAQQSAVNLSASALATKGLTIRQFAVLAALHSQSGQSQSELVETTGIDRSTLADMVSRMEKSSLVKRAVSKTDARVRAVSLSVAGARAYRAAAEEVETADAALLKGLRKSSRASLINALAVIAGEAEEAKPKKAKKVGKPAKKKKKKKKKKSG
ncbi:MAG: MarR family transcriptional regulator [Henriciella sp.]|nr:MarR family transcriptional regulator [Henriciella sp.]